MKTITALAAFAASCLPAAAEVSEDLKFCGSLNSGAERLACYDAAARIAARPATTRPLARAAPLDAHAAVPVKAAALDTPPARNPFDGYYAAIGGGYGLATGRDFASVSNGVTQGFFTFPSMSGPNASVAVGRNIAIGWGLVGLELSGRWAGEKFQDSHGGLAFNCCAPSGFVGYSYQNDGGAHASLRAGATFDDLLVFGKVGIGASHVAETFLVDGARIRADSWLPSALFGFGVEKNWGPFFARLSAEFEAFNHQATSVSGAGVTGSSGAEHITWTTRGTAMIGVRF